MNDPKKADAANPATPSNGADIQGEGNYDASRRHRAQAERFVQSGRVEPAAEAAAPKDAAEAEALKKAERVGESKARH